ncbi:fertilization-influencing membrane protein isoform X2 [Symphalangus syndactylus]|uniref:fertilization-influencing membrane protein isoform X2 n=1 Tax=Symphalangus syndactylus TaxID=9590 RepID=UPI0024431F02|nr:fertilization-influencing membrane protein isoform X2 [Symphalangus syndactylus]
MGAGVGVAGCTRGHRNWVPSQLLPREIKAGVSLAVVTDFAWVLAPRPKRATASALGTESLRFLDRPDFFNYPDSDQARLLAVAQFIEEKPIVFINSGSSPGLFHHILVGFLVVAFFFLLFQFCTHINFQKGA